MQVSKPGGTREQVAVGAWLEISTLARKQVAELPPVPTLATCYDTWTAAGARFGASELYARALDRSVELDVFGDRRKSLDRQLARRNEEGIALLDQLREQLPALEKELATVDLDPALVEDTLAQLEVELREGLADWDMKGSDARKLFGVFEETRDVILSDGLSGIAPYLDKKFAELAEGRRRPDRGNYDNILWWKLMFLVGAFGWMIAGAIIHAVWGRQWGGVIAVAWGIIEISHWVAFVLFC